MAVTVLANLESPAFSIVADASPALETGWATATVIQILAQGSDFSAVWFSLLPVELRVCDSRLGSIASCDALRQFIHPSEFTRHGREVACWCNADFEVAFLLSDIPFTVVRTHDGHRLCLVHPPAQVIINRTIKLGIIALEYRTWDLGTVDQLHDQGDQDYETALRFELGLLRHLCHLMIFFLCEKFKLIILIQ